MSVQTPESIAFSYELAGLGSRFLALVLDFIVQGIIFSAIIWGLVLLAAGAPRATHAVASTSEKTAESLATAAIIALVFIVFFAYFIVFETFWNGRTPGKKLMGLRVVRDGGYPIDFTSAAIRNLVRVGEVALGFYAISAVVCVLSPENKRLGDLAAGTIVVRDSPVASLSTLVSQSREPVRTHLLSEREHAVIDEFVARRRSLTPAVRAQLAARIAAQVRDRVPADLQQLSDDELLMRISAS